jgi:protein-disulfide isomerase
VKLFSSKRVLAAGVMFALLAGAMPAQAPKKTAAKSPAKAAGPTPTELKSLGRKSAPIVMDVFSDYQCPACRDLYFSTVRPVIENYVTAGKVLLVHRDFPLPPATHPHARDASRYANAAARLRKLDLVVQALFDQQPKWSADGNIDAVVAAVLTPVEMRRVRELIKSGSLEPGIDEDLALGRQHRVTQTPTTIITHKGQVYPIVGVMSYKVMKQFLDSLLAQ